MALRPARPRTRRPARRRSACGWSASAAPTSTPSTPGTPSSPCPTAPGTRSGGGLTDRLTIGADTIDLLTLAAARQAGAARIAVSEPSPAKRALAAALGADSTHDAAAPDMVRDIRDDLGTSADVVFDCVSVQSSVDQAVAIAVKGGTVVIVGVPVAPVTMPLPAIQDHQVRVQGSATYTREDIHRPAGRRGRADRRGVVSCASQD